MHLVTATLIWMSLSRDDVAAEDCELYGVARLDFKCNNLSWNSSDYVNASLASHVPPATSIGVSLKASDVSGLAPDLFRGYRVTAFRCYFCDIPVFPFDAMRSFGDELERVDIGDSNISRIRSVADMPFRERVKEISLRFGNRIGEIEPYAFAAYPSLERLYVNNNSEISRIAEHAFADMPRVTHISLSSNVTSIPRTAFRRLPALKTLLIHNNSLSSLEAGTFTREALPALTVLRLDDNPWRCDCRLQWLNEFAKSRRPDEGGIPHCDKPKVKFFETDFCRNAGNLANVLSTALLVISASRIVLDD